MADVVVVVVVVAVVVVTAYMLDRKEEEAENKYRKNHVFNQGTKLCEQVENNYYSEKLSSAGEISIIVVGNII